MRFRLGDWTVEIDRNLVLRGRESVRLEPKASAVLRALHARGGEVVTREELLAEVWGGAAVSDEVLTTAIYQLRRTLGDDRRAPRFIETIPRRGYRLVAGVDEAAAVRRGPSRLAAVIAAAIAAAALVLGSSERRVERRTASELHRLASMSLTRGVDLAASGRMLRRAAELDPRNASIAGSLALALALDEASPPEEARRAADRALRLDGGNRDAHLARALVALWADWNWEEARRGLQRAAAGGDPIPRAWQAYVSALAGERSDALGALDGITAPPLAAITASTALLFLGDLAEAERVASAAMRVDSGNPALARQLGKIRDRRLELAGAPAPLFDGDSEAALASLERAFRERDSRLLYLKVDRRWDPIRRHPRFQTVAAAVGP